MSRIQIQCDGCGARISLAVRQNHEARELLERKGWMSKDGSGNRHGSTGTLKEDFCPDCQS